MLLVDEAHWADRPSMQAVVFALRRLVADRVLAIVAVRDDRVADLPDSLRPAVAGQRGTVLRLRGLDEVDLHDLAGAIGVPGLSASGRAPAALRDAGKPVARQGVARGVPAVRVGRRGTGRTSRCRRRGRSGGWSRTATRACSPTTQRLIDAAAVLGPALPAAAGRRAGRDRAAAARARRGDRGRPARHVPARKPPWRLSFPHPLVRSAVYEGMRPGRRHELHSAAAVLVDDGAIGPAAPGRRRHRGRRRPRRRPDRLRRRGGRTTGLPQRRRAISSPRPAELGPTAGAREGAPRGGLDGAPRRRRHGRPPSPPRSRPTTTGRCATWRSGRSRWRRTTRPTAEDLLAAPGARAGGWAPRSARSSALMIGIHWFGRLDASATVEWCERARAAADPVEPAVRRCDELPAARPRLRRRARTTPCAPRWSPRRDRRPDPPLDEPAFGPRPDAPRRRRHRRRPNGSSPRRRRPRPGWA